ncbi:MAG: hypothetical protein ABEJ26_13820 [Halosimplex sp.]
MDSITDEVEASIRPGDNVLVMCPSFAGGECDACPDLLTPVPPSEVNALSVLFTDSPGDHLDDWERCVGTLPARSHIVSVDADARSKANIEHDVAGQDVERINSPQNLTKLGVRITDCLDDWAETTPDVQVAVCFQSISTLLQYVELQQVLKFLNVVTEQCAATDALAHYHLDPRAHDEQTTAKLIELFGTVFEYEGGEWVQRA